MATIEWDIVGDRVKKLGKLLYWIIGITIVASISYILYTRMNKQIAAVLVFMVSMLALYYYYVKWIIIGDEFTPPVSTCPDFMTNLGVYPGRKQFVCADANGIYKQSFKASNTPLPAVTDGMFQNPSDAGIVDMNAGRVLTPTADNTGTFCTTLKMNNISWISLCEA